MTYPNPENMTSVIDIFQYANTVSKLIYGVGIAIALYLIILLYLDGKGEDFVDSAIASGFTTVIFSMFLYLAGLLGGWHFWMVLAMCIIPAAWAFVKKSG